jgi:catechol 2,3-dioxygenase-like lactoylglutathione lyase family enzyme
MGIHHMAFATKDLEATHRFYTEVMGFDLVKVVAGPTEGGGWSKHLFYDTGEQGLIAFWDLHDDTIGSDFRTDISKGMGLPVWVNHLAFDAPTPDALDARRRHWQDQGVTVTELDHGWCRSIYTLDPNGILVEFCNTTRAFTDADRAEAARLLADPDPELEDPPPFTVHRPTVTTPS